MPRAAPSRMTPNSRALRSAWDSAGDGGGRWRRLAGVRPVRAKASAVRVLPLYSIFSVRPANCTRSRTSRPPARLFTDMQSGIFERFQSLPIARSSVLWAHVLTTVVSSMISLVIVVLVALLLGFRSGAGALAWLAVIGILVLFTMALTWIAVIAGLTAKSAEGAGAFSYPLIFLPFISSAFVPTRTMPGPVRAFANNQPVTSIVNTIHDLFTQHPVSSSIWTALAWCIGILIVAYALAIATYRRKIAQG